MATLEKIRAKQGLLFGVIIVALFLFIITMAGNPTDWFRSFHRDTMLKAGNIEVSQQENYEIQQQRAHNGADGDSLTQATLENLLLQKLLREQYDEVGISVPDEQLAYFINNSPDPTIRRVVGTLSYQLLGLDQPDAARLAGLINNPSINNLTTEQLDAIANNFGFNSMRALWLQIENIAEGTFQETIYNQLLEGLFTSNDLDAQSVYDDSFKTRNVSYVSTPLSSLQDSTINITDADLKAKWQEMKSSFKVAEPTRIIDYVVIPIVPSQADYDAAEAIVNDNVKLLQDIPGEEGIAQVTGMECETASLTEKDIKDNQILRSMPEEQLVTEGLYKFPRRNNTFYVAKVTDVKNMVDSVNYSMYIAISPEIADSVTNALRTGATSFKALAEENPQVAADSLWVRMSNFDTTAPWFDPIETPAKFEKAIASYDAANRPYMYVDTIVNGTDSLFNIVQIRKHLAPLSVYDMAVFSLTVDPSNATETDLRTDLTNFIATNNTGEKFSTAADSLYRLQKAMVSPSTAHVGQSQYSKGLADSRQMVKWAMNAKKGEVSKVFPNTNYYAAATVKEIIDGEYIPYDSELIKDYLTNLVLAEKKAQVLGEKYNANSLEEYAQQMNSMVQNDERFSFFGSQLGTLRGNMVYDVLGAAAAAAPGTIVGPLQDNNSLIFIEVIAENPVEARELDTERDGSTFVRQYRFNVGNPAVKRDLLLGKRKVQNKSLDFIGER